MRGMVLLGVGVGVAIIAVVIVVGAVSAIVAAVIDFDWMEDKRRGMAQLG